MESCSDDAGFFSEDSRLSQDLDMDLVDEDELNYRYPILLKKYLSLVPEHVKFPFEIDFDELLGVLRRSGQVSPLAVSAELLHITVRVWSSQVNLVNQNVCRQVEGIERDKKNARRKRNPSISPSKGSIIGENLQDLNHSFSQDSGFGSQPQPEEERWSQRGSSRKENNPDSLSKRVINRKGRNENKCIPEEKESAITFQQEESAPDVISRRRFLHDRFRELAYDTLYCDFNIHYQYGSELTDARSTNVMDADASTIFRHIFSENNGRHLKGMTHLVFFDWESAFSYGESGSASEEEAELADVCLENQNNHDEDYAGENPTSNNENDVNMESENIQPSPPPIAGTVQLTSISPPLPNEQENLTVTAFVAEFASKAKQEQDQRKKRGRADRGPLGLLNVAADGTPLEPTDDGSPEAKRARISDAVETLDVSSILIGREWNSFSDFPELDVAPPEFPEVAEFSSLQDSLQCDDLEGLNMNERATSPLFLTPASSNATLLRPPPVDVKAVINKMTNTAIRELEHRPELPFVELLKESNVNIVPKEKWETIEPSVRNDTDMSAAMAFFAALHMAHSNDLYLIPFEDQFNVTATKPLEEPFE